MDSTELNAYWEKRYATGGNSGLGTYGAWGKMKADLVNKFITKYSLKTVKDFGCGDGNQAASLGFEMYHGFDWAPSAISLCLKKYAGDPTKSFKHNSEYVSFPTDTNMSLDVIYHIVNDHDLEVYFKRLFDQCSYVIIHSTFFDGDVNELGHAKSRDIGRLIQRFGINCTQLEFEPCYGETHVALYKNG